MPSPRRPQLWIAYLTLAVITLGVGIPLASYFDDLSRAETLAWKNPWALLLLGGAVLLAWVCLHLQSRRAPTFSFSRVRDAAAIRRGLVSRLAALPAVMRIVAVALIAVALARPQTFHTVDRHVEGIDIMIVLDLSKSMEESDLHRDRLDAGQRTIRRFLRHRKNDRIGLVAFGKVPVLQCPLTLDYHALDQIVADLQIGDVPPMGTAIGDALGLALASLRRSHANSRVIILVTDGDNNVATKMDPQEAKALAKKMGVRVFTILMGREGAVGPFGTRRSDVNPQLLQTIARDTGGKFFRAGDDAELEHSFRQVRKMLDKSRHRVTGRVADKELFPQLLWIAAALLLVELALRMSRWRRFP